MGSETPRVVFCGLNAGVIHEYTNMEDDDGRHVPFRPPRQLFGAAASAVAIEPPRSTSTVQPPSLQLCLNLIDVHISRGKHERPSPK